MAARRLKIQGKTYKVPNLDDLTIDDIMMLDLDLKDRYRSSWVDVQDFVNDCDTMTEAEAERHPMAVIMSGVTIWMVLRVAGQEVTLQEAASIKGSEIEEVAEAAPKDRQPKKGSKPRTRKGSAAGTAATTLSVSSATPDPQSTSSLPTTSSESSASA